MENIDWKNLPFGYMKTDYNVRSYYRNGKWGRPCVVFTITKICNMNKRCFLPIVAALVLATSFLSCKKDDGNSVKLLRLERGSSSFHSYRTFEYDDQHRLTKILMRINSEKEPISTQTLLYSKNDLVKFDDYILTMVGSDKLTYSDGSNTHTFELNSDGTLAKMSTTYADGRTYKVNYQYQTGNLTKRMDEYTVNGVSSVGTNEMDYDSMNSPFINCNTPSWWLIWRLGSTKNNITEATWVTNGQSGKTVYSYEYDNEGYPTKCFIGKEVANYYSYDK